MASIATDGDATPGGGDLELIPPGEAGAGGSDGEPPCPTPDGCGPTSLYHYTTESKMNQILDTNELWASTKAAKPQDAKLGDGQYLSDIVPGAKTQGQLARTFYGTPWGGQNFTNYIEIDVQGLQLVPSPDRPGVFLVPNDGPLDLTNRIVGSGRN
jgi:HYD1 signature containing ADP-ribosyltransferase